MTGWWDSHRTSVVAKRTKNYAFIDNLDKNRLSKSGQIIYRKNIYLKCFGMSFIAMDEKTPRFIDSYSNESQRSGDKHAEQHTDNPRASKRTGDHYRIITLSHVVKRGKKSLVYFYWLAMLITVRSHSHFSPTDYDCRRWILYGHELNAMYTQ